MHSEIEMSAQAIADALAPTQTTPSARWRWGTVKSVSEYGTMNVEVGGSELVGIRCAQHVMGAQVGDRVRVSYYGTEAIVDAVRAVEQMASIPTIDGEMDETSKAAWRTALAPDVLYDNASGTNGTVTLSNSAANYTHMTIYYKSGDNTYGSTNVYSPNGKLVWLFDAFPNNGGLPTYIKFKVVSISGTSIAASGSRYSAGYFNGSGSSMAGSNAIYITRVEAW